MISSKEPFEESGGVIVFGDETAHESPGPLGVLLDGFQLEEGAALEFFL